MLALRPLVAGLLTLFVVGVSGAHAAEPPAPNTSTAAADSTPEPKPKSKADLQWEKDNAEVRRLAAENPGGLGLDDEDRGEAPADAPSLVGTLIQMIGVLGTVCLLAYLVLGKLLPRLLRVPNPSGRTKIMRVVDRLPIDQRRSILIIEVGDQYFMVGASEGNISLISRVEADTIAQATPPSTGTPAGLGRFAEALVGRGSKEG